MLFTDSPIHSKSQDTLKRKRFTKQLAKAILSWKSREPLVVGVYGRWGDGKSSALYLLKEEIGEKAAVALFDPWYFNSQEELIRSFFLNTFGVISQNLPWYSKWKIRNNAQAFSKILTSLPISITYQGFALSIKDFQGKGINPVQKEELIKSLKEREKFDKRKIVILIDNIDRLTPEEILLMLKLIRLCADFENMIYVLAFDDNYVIEAINQYLNTSNSSITGEEYLKKIIQIDTRLPAISETFIDKLIDNSFDEISKKHNLKLEEDFRNRFSVFYTTHIRGKVISNLRDAKKLMNAIAFGIPLIKAEVNYADWLVIETLRVFCPRSYLLLQENVSLLAPDYINASFTMYDHERQEYSKKLNDLTSKLPSQDKEFATSAFQYLFPIYSSWITNPKNLSFPSSYSYTDFNRNQRLTSPDYRDAYFQFEPKAGKISGKMLSTFIDEINQRPRTQVADFIKNQILNFKRAELLKDFFDKLILRTERIDRAVDEHFIVTIVALAHIYSKESDFFKDSEEDRSQALLYSIVEQNKDSTTVQSLLEKAIEEASTEAYAVAIMLFSLPERNRIISDFSLINYDKLKDVLQKRLNDYYLIQDNDIFSLERSEYAFIIYQWAGPLLNDSKTVVEYLGRVFKRQNKYLGKFLEIFVTRNAIREDILVLDIEKFEKIFDKSWIRNLIDGSLERYFETDKEKWAVTEFLSKTNTNVQSTDIKPDD